MKEPKQQEQPYLDWSIAMRVLISRLSVVFVGWAVLALQAGAQTPAQTIFPTPDDAAIALQHAFAANDAAQMEAIFPGALKEFSSGDPVADKQDRQVIALAMEETWRWVSYGANRKELIIGDEQWPFPVPLVKQGTGWVFDVKAGEEEVLARRVGRNELAAIAICRAYVAIQKEYASQGHDGKDPGIYAQQIRSTPGRQDGLYWEVKPGEPHSPMGDLAAHAEAAGYKREGPSTDPFMGYYYRILTSQGSSAPGGAKDYVVNGNMTGGFALLTYPAKYGYSGVMTFVVSQSGVVYQRDLGQDTLKLAADITTYNPDKSWTKVQTSKTAQ